MEFDEKDQYVANAIRTALKMHSDGDEKQDILCHLLYKLKQLLQSDYVFFVERRGPSVPLNPSNPPPLAVRENSAEKFDKVRDSDEMAENSDENRPIFLHILNKELPALKQSLQSEKNVEMISSLRVPESDVLLKKKKKKKPWSFRTMRSSSTHPRLHNTDLHNLHEKPSNNDIFRTYRLDQSELNGVLQTMQNDSKNSCNNNYDLGGGFVFGVSPEDRAYIKEFANTIQIVVQLYHQEVQQQDQKDGRLFHEMVKTMALPLIVFDYRNATDAVSFLVDPTRMACSYVNDAFSELTNFYLTGAPDQQYADGFHNPFKHLLSQPDILKCIQEIMRNSKGTYRNLVSLEPLFDIESEELPNADDGLVISDNIAEHPISASLSTSLSASTSSSSLDGSWDGSGSGSSGIDGIVDCTGGIDPARIFSLTHSATAGCQSLRCVVKVEYGDDIVPKSHYEIYVYRVNGSRVGLMFRDISERVKHLRLIEQASKAKSDFLANINHELRTPLNGIDGNLQLLTKTSPLSEKQEDLIHRMRISTTALMSILQEILDYSKLEQHKITLQMAPFSIRHCIQATFDVLSGQANKKNINLTYDMDLEVPLNVIGDSFRLQQVLINLVSNAIKFTDTGNIKVIISVTGITAGNDFASNNDIGSDKLLRFDIVDTGRGIDLKDRERLFLPWVQLNSTLSRHEEGTGLGLAICRELCTLMGGRIWLEKSDLDVGSTMSFVIPLHSADAVLGRKKSSEELMIESVLKNKNILIVDDNAENRRMLMRITLQWKMKPTMCASAAEAIDYWRADYQFDVALIDICMPEMNGNELAEYLSTTNTSDRRMFPLLALSSAGADSIEISPHFQKVLYKPLRFEKLCDVLFNLFQNANDQKYSNTETKGQKESSFPSLGNNDSARVYNSDIALQDSALHVTGSEDISVLVVEDVEANKMVLFDMLQLMGFKDVDMCENGQEMLQMTAKKQYHVILLDLLMPVMNGLEAAKIFRQTHKIGTLPFIVAVTATSMLANKKKEYQKAGMDAFLSKPIKMTELFTLLTIITERGQDTAKPNGLEPPT